jgi:methylmalonyl-CoA/ethylmalonyl-CoA epimerase
VLEAFAGLVPFQVALVVHDLDRVARNFDAVLSAGPWRGYVLGSDSVEDSRYHGEPVSWSARVALNDDRPQFELIQPLAGPSIHADWLSARGEGFHHLGYVVDSVAETTAQMTLAGFPAIQTGHSFGAKGDGEFAYYDTAASLGFIVEAVEPPASMPAPAFRL